MAEKFDNFSKHLATKQSRRGLFKFLGAGVVGAALTTIFSREADAGRGRTPRTVFDNKLPPRASWIFNSFYFNYTQPMEPIDLNSTTSDK